MLPRFDSRDSRIAHWPLYLERPLGAVPAYPLPEGFRFVFFGAGDREAWIEIERSAKESSSYEEGAAAWERIFGGREALLGERMVFVADAKGEKIATATAYYDVSGRDGPETGWLRRVAVRRDFQGRGLSKPLIAHTLGLMGPMGCTRAKVHTQTESWLACRIYLDLGFRPTAESAEESQPGWRIIRRLTHHPALTAFPPTRDEDVTVGHEI